MKEAERFLRYMLLCARHETPFDLKSHVPRIRRILGAHQEENKDQLLMFKEPALHSNNLSQDV